MYAVNNNSVLLFTGKTAMFGVLCSVQGAKLCKGIMKTNYVQKRETDTMKRL